jgi:uncharacterized flavoprotein (TIGR03862 family)
VRKETSHLKEKINIIGAGTSGLFLTLDLLRKGYQVDLYEQSGGVLKKFLIAGKGGLNLTHAEKQNLFIKKYGINEQYFQKYLSHLTNEDLREWFLELGVETFVGSSQRVFPKDKSAGDILNLWLEKCSSFSNFSFYPKHRLIDYDNGIILETSEGSKICLNKNNIVLALGGASYKKTGSDGNWLGILNKMNIKTTRFEAINCGYEIKWTGDFKNKMAHKPLKNIIVKTINQKLRGEILITDYGIEGSAIYALSRTINNTLKEKGACEIRLDLKPDLSIEEIKLKLAKPKNKNSQSNYLRKTLKLDNSSLEILKFCSTKKEYNNLRLLPEIIKNCPLILEKARPIDEAISTSGGINFSELNPDLSLKK